MTSKEIYEFRERVSGYIDKRRLRDAINEIKDLSRRKVIWEIEDKVKQVEQSYDYMLKYLTQGVNDPERNDVYNGLILDIYGLLDSLISYLERVDNPSLYYSTLRYNNMHPVQNSLESIISEYQSANDKMSLYALSLEPSEEEKTARRNIEKQQSDLFMRIWSTPQLSNEDMSAINQLLEAGQVPVGAKQHIVSAVTMGLQQQYDTRKLQILILTYLTSTNIKVSSAALVGMLLGLWRYRNRPLSRRINDMLMTVKDSPSWQSDLRIAFLEMIRARDTERINRKMRDEVLPRMSKLRPDMLDKLNGMNINPEDPASLQENPEWQELLDNSGITDQLKELTEIQMEGGDVMMSTFSQLKQFPFFNNLSNWFLPFDGHNSMVANTVTELDIIGDMMESAQFLCDSDKYSFMFAIGSVPAVQKEMMISQMKAQSETIYQAMGDMNANQGPESRRLAVNSYMQNIYRFFKLYGRRNEFFDPFNGGINLISVKALSSEFDDTEMLKVVAEFYFKLKYMQDALDVYLHLEALEPGDSSRYQKIGYCYERLRDYDNAIDYYHKAELSDTVSAWTIKRLAVCYKLIGDKARSMKYYKQLASMLPDDLNVALMLGQSLLENGRYTEAIQQLYKVEFLDSNNTRTWRPLAWTLFLTGDLEGAQRYYNKILMDNPTANDYLNMGHVAVAFGNLRDAVNNYTMAIKASQGDKEWFMQALANDEPDLRRAGIDTMLMPLIADATMYAVS